MNVLEEKLCLDLYSKLTTTVSYSVVIVVMMTTALNKSETGKDQSEQLLLNSFLAELSDSGRMRLQKQSYLSKDVSSFPNSMNRNC